MVPGMLYAPDKTGWESSHTVRRLFPLILLILALLPRLVAVNRYITPDELTWMYRSVQFREALADGRWQETLVAGHPGATTTWLGAAAISTQLVISPADRETYDWLATMAYLTPDNTAAFDRLASFLSGARLAVALVNALGLVAIYYLVDRFWSATIAVLAVLLLALDPFVAGLSGLLHVDGLSTTWVTLSLLLLLPALGPAGSGRPALWLALSGVAGGLAVWTKTPTGVVAVVAAVAIAVTALRDSSRPLAGRLARMVGWGVAWAAPFLLTGVLLLPALWSAPATVYATLTGNASRHLEEALRPTFFLGDVAFVHGPLFYPVALLWRSSPVVVLAILPAAWLSWRRELAPARDGKGNISVWPLLLWVALFTLIVTLAAKKFDRYILPVIPALTLLATLVWAAWGQRRGGRWWLPALVLAQAAYLAFFWWTPLAAYNPLAGGPWTAQQVLPIGWAEGISYGGSWLTDNLPEPTAERALGGVAPSLAPFFAGTTLVEGYDDPASAGYIILTENGRQLDPAAFEQQQARLELVQTVRYGGLDQAWIFRQPQAQADSRAAAPLEAPVRFGPEMALTAAALSTADDTLLLAARWNRLQSVPADGRYTVAIGVRDEAGNEWAGIEADLLDAVYFHPPDWLNDESGEVRYRLELPPAIPPGSYEVDLSLVDQRTGGRLPVQQQDGRFGGVVYEVGAIDIPLPADPVATPRLQVPVAEGQQWLDGALRLLGHGGVPEALLAGSSLTADLFWHAEGLLPEQMALDWSLARDGGDPAVPLAQLPLSRHDTGQWRIGESIQEKYRLSLPPELAPGSYTLLVQPVVDGVGLGDFPFEVGGLRVNNIDRQFELPADRGTEVAALFGSDLWLRGVDAGPRTAAAGEAWPLTLVWQAAREPDAVYNVFVHLLDADGGIVAQSDHWPGGLPTDVWAAGQVVVDALSLPLPSDLRPGVYSLAIGLYNPLTGERLLIDGGGETADRLLLPDVLTVE